MVESRIPLLLVKPHQLGQAICTPYAILSRSRTVAHSRPRCQAERRPVWFPHFPRLGFQQPTAPGSPRTRASQRVGFLNREGDAEAEERE